MRLNSSFRSSKLLPLLVSCKLHSRRPTHTTPHEAAELGILDLIYTDNYTAYSVSSLMSAAVQMGITSVADIGMSLAPSIQVSRVSAVCL